jgi:hypothetical protein
MQVSHRPVVSLNSGDRESQSAQPRESVATATNSQVAENAFDQEAASAVVETDANGQPFVRDGVRFSSLFKPDGGLEPA